MIGPCKASYGVLPLAYLWYNPTTQPGRPQPGGYLALSRTSHSSIRPHQGEASNTHLVLQQSHLLLTFNPVDGFGT